jgi:hypothetical protein
MGYIQIDSSLVPVENQEANILSSSARTTAQSVDINTLTAKDIFIIVDVTAFTSAVAEVASLAVTGIPTVAGNITVTLNGVGFPVAVDPLVETTTTLVASKIRGTAMAGWTLGGSGTTVTFTATTGGTRTDATFSAGTTTTAATMTTTTQGVDSAGLTPRLYGLTPTGSKEFSLGAPAKITATGTYVYVYTPTTGTAHDGLTGVYYTPIPKRLRFRTTVDNANSITYSVDYIISI